MKNLSITLLLLTISSLAIGQTKGFSNLSAEQKKAELNKKLQWINSKMGVRNGWRTLEVVEGFGTVDNYEYDTLLWNKDLPNIVRIETKVRVIKPKKANQKDVYQELRTVTIDLSKVYQVKHINGSEKTKLVGTDGSGGVLIKFIGNEMELSTYKEQPYFTSQYNRPPQGEPSNGKTFSVTAHFDPALKGQAIIDVWNDAIALAGGGKMLEKGFRNEPELFGKLTRHIQERIFAADTATISSHKIKSFAINAFGDVVISSNSLSTPERFNLLNLISNLSNTNNGFIREAETLVFYTNIEQVMREDNTTSEVVRVLELKFANADAAKEVELDLVALYRYLLSPAIETP